jgi:4-amino-4-deoxychorismate lyase
VACDETELSLPELLQAEEVFLTNSLFGIWPVRRIGETRFEVGPLTRQMSKALDRIVAE